MIHQLLKEIVLLPIRFYRVAISPMLGPKCRFQPTCSRYAMDAIEEWGIFKGSWLALRRIFKCHPWGPFGYDPVPKNPKKYRHNA
ncbi:MAG TPA: membrane protein insertion efficiency factor YidD [Saprospiraceae bacterium]|nr:membrane protein insertion efficiency factor YidD [Saprospiraceae bacterium]HMQ83028.1 membrane protein insertion efficiency factor YidD [Saprospiraceae bacterium]